MKKAFLHIISVILAVLVLFSTFSFTIEKHLCGGEIADVSFTGNLERCLMPGTDQDDNHETSLHTMPCCQDIVETIESSNDELTVIKELDVRQQEFVQAFIYSYLNLFEGLAQNAVPFKDYEPPLVTKDIQVLHDTFLI